jgi:hypothetical protein
MTMRGGSVRQKVEFPLREYAKVCAHERASALKPNYFRLVPSTTVAPSDFVHSVNEPSYIATS